MSCDSMELPLFCEAQADLRLGLSFRSAEASPLPLPLAREERRGASDEHAWHRLRLKKRTFRLSALCKGGSAGHRTSPTGPHSVLNDQRAPGICGVLSVVKLATNNYDQNVTLTYQEDMECLCDFDHTLFALSCLDSRTFSPIKDLCAPWFCGLFLAFEVAESNIDPPLVSDERCLRPVVVGPRGVAEHYDLTADDSELENSVETVHVMERWLERLPPLHHV